MVESSVEKTAEELEHSRPLDVHTWSEHKEVNQFVDQIHEQHFSTRLSNIRKKHQDRKKAAVIEIQPTPIPSVSIGSKQFQRQQEIWRQNQQNWQDFQQQWNSGNLMMAPAPLCTICN